MKLTLGPVLFGWKRDELLGFYEEAVGFDVDRVYIGTVVCAKQRGLTIEDIESIAAGLESAGKTVVLSSLAVVSNETELAQTREFVALPFPIEANDVSVLNMADPALREVFAGPHITTYNVPSIEFLKGIGIKHVTFPVELSGESIAYNIAHTAIDAEVFAHGKVPLAFSWRCYTSRAYGLSKTDCRHDCTRSPDGMVIKTVENEPLFTINGTSILSAGVYTLIGEVDDLGDKGVGALRISPQHKDTRRVVEVFRARIDGTLGAREAAAEIEALSPEGISNGWYHGRAGRAGLAG